MGSCTQPPAQPAHKDTHTHTSPPAVVVTIIIAVVVTHTVRDVYRSFKGRRCVLSPARTTTPDMLSARCCVACKTLWLEPGAISNTHLWLAQQRLHSMHNEQQRDTQLYNQRNPKHQMSEASQIKAERRRPFTHIQNTHLAIP